MTYGISKLTVARLVEQVDRMDNRLALPMCSKKVTVAERKLIEKVVGRGKGAVVYRNGWPDFLIEEAGELFAIEVKHKRGEKLRPQQRALFPMLERVGMRVFVWAPDYPDKLVPWRRWDEGPRKRRDVWRKHLAARAKARLSRAARVSQNQLAEH